MGSPVAPYRYYILFVVTGIYHNLLRECRASSKVSTGKIANWVKYNVTKKFIDKILSILGICILYLSVSSCGRNQKDSDPPFTHCAWIYTNSQVFQFRSKFDSLCRMCRRILTTKFIFQTDRWMGRARITLKITNYTSLSHIWGLWSPFPSVTFFVNKWNIPILWAFNALFIWWMTARSRLTNF